MRTNLRRLLCGLAAGAALTGPAAAEERLVMPFACHVAGGQVSLAPSAPQTYPIYGHREQKRMTTCSPYDPGKCHNWSVHRFDLDCGGARTSWHSVVAALSPMLAESVGAPGNAYAAPYAGPYEDPAYAPQGRAGPYRLGQGPAISFPPGFAPNPMKIARFERTSAAPANAPLPPKKPDLTAPTQVAALARPSAEPDAAPSASDGSDDKVEDAGKTAPAEQKATEVAERRALKIEIESGSGEVTGSLPSSGAAPWWDASMIFTLTLAILFALSATLFLGRRKMLNLPAPVPRLHGPTGLRALVRRSASGLAETAAEPTDAPPPRLRLWDEDWLPATTHEALDVLGVDPHASRDRIKSTVTRLRRALHPDYALDAEDRALRERRLKQINVAWEIVSGRRRALFLSAKPRSS